MTIEEFIKARIAEDRLAARAAPDRDKALRRCDALRDAVEIMRDCTVRRTAVDEYDRLSPQERALQYIAAIWSDHANYDERWTV